jgi:hypothetical protein
MLQDKKIAFGVNLFGTARRVDLAIESYVKIKQKYPDNIDLYNIQFADTSIKGREHSEFKTIRALRESSKNYITGESKRTIPMLRGLFDSLSDLNYEYFCFTNDDIILSNRYLDFILSTDYDCYPASRLAIEPIENLSDKIIPSHYQVAGFDTFCVRNSWWKKHRERFPNYILGTPPWDVHYATLCMKYGNSTLCNKWPAPTFHLIHGDDAHLPSPEVSYNSSLFWVPHKFDSDMWHNYLFNVLLRREGENYWKPFPNELELEKQYFSEEWFKNNYWSYQ